MHDKIHVTHYKLINKLICTFVSHNQVKHYSYKSSKLSTSLTSTRKNRSLWDNEVSLKINTIIHMYNTLSYFPVKLMV